jgi:serine/threonine protein kinase
MTLINKTIAQYEVISKIGEGGMDEVYRARDTK